MKWWQRSTPSETPVNTDGAVPNAPRRRIQNLVGPLAKPRLLLGIASICALGGAILAAPYWLPDLNKRPEYQVKADLIKITPPPDYVPSDFLTNVLKEGGLPETLSILDPDLVPNIVKAFQGSAWVQEVVQVRKAFPGELTVELRYRTPVAMIRFPEGRYPVDAEGIVLPPEDFTPAIAARYPEILNAPPEQSINLGRPWNNPLVCEAAQLLARLHDQIEKYDLSGIEVPELDPDGNPGPFILKTKSNTEIVWGTGPSQDRPGQVSTRMKIDRLEDLGKTYGGSLDAGNDAMIDLTLLNSIRTVKRTIAEQPDPDRRRN